MTCDSIVMIINVNICLTPFNEFTCSQNSYGLLTDAEGYLRDVTHSPV